MLAASCLASWACDAWRTGIGRRSARIAYCGFFALSLVLPWILREVAPPLLEKLPWINHFHETPNREWFETDSVLRISMGNFLFFTILSFLMVGVKNQKDAIHHGGWMMKIICWCVLVILMFFLPNQIISFYEMISKFGSWLFLLVQSVLLLDFAHGCNYDKWVANNYKFWYVALLAVSIVCYVGSLLFSGLLVYWLLPFEKDCELNTWFIITIVSFVLGSGLLPWEPDVTAGVSFVPVSVLSFYCMYLCYTGLASEPRDYECNILLKHSKAVSTVSLTVGLLTTVVSLVYSAVRAGPLLSPPSSPSAGEEPLLPMSEEKDKDVSTVTYSCAFFHITFSLATMYSAMLLTSSGELIDVGWPSVWFRIITAFATAILYLGSLVAAACVAR